ncbi:LacI family transcriptional regulator [Bifidobacterium lemurum]|uniref:LacI family transcriptional regulator n=1 Tax=Bifidobacterium lemurum TaxID=1603886 RepID=A0A261FRR0_9BIFI|nr:LacI family DNA-binding transcriptional regulator [Bifidobacterium lemurum]OZG61819.1 LacI family transcriptional regulator [Bifidobacterium lemurum]QOL34962.1 LacI family DNA-binding transcriptional regulator [Bifidobacterium lemurum]
MARADIHEVAKAAGVSISTVSRAFTRPDMVSEKTRRKVLEAANRLEFTISRSAGSLKTGQANRVALLMNDTITSWFNVQVFAGLNATLRDEGYDIAVYDHIDTAETRREFFDTMPVRHNVDAVFVASIAIDPNEVGQLKSMHVPLIGINTSASDSLDASIRIDDEEGMFTATQHLIGLGHRRIVYVCSAASVSLDASVDARGRGFIRACESAVAAGRDLDWQTITVPRGPEFIDSALAELLALDRFPDAICCQMDMLAIPLVTRLARYGHRVPQDYSIIGFDDMQNADWVNLTTMRQNPQDMGRDAAHKALALMRGETLDQPHEIIRPRLVLRGTDAPFPR